MSAETSRRASENDGIAARSVSLSALGVYTLLPSTGREQFVRVQTIRFRGMKAGHVEWSSEAPWPAAEPHDAELLHGRSTTVAVAGSPSPMVRFSTSSGSRVPCVRGGSARVDVGRSSCCRRRYSPRPPGAAAPAREAARGRHTVARARRRRRARDARHDRLEQRARIAGRMSHPARGAGRRSRTSHDVRQPDRVRGPPRNPDLYSDIPSSIIPPHRQKKNSAKNIVSNMNVPAALPATNLRSPERARAAVGSASIAFDTAGDWWLMTIERDTTDHRGGQHVTQVGPLPLPQAARYTMMVQSARRVHARHVLASTSSLPCRSGLRARGRSVLRDTDSRRKAAEGRNARSSGRHADASCGHRISASPCLGRHRS